MITKIFALAFLLYITTLSSAAKAAGIDSHIYTCEGLRSLISEHGFVFISQATFGDFAVASASFCSGGRFLALRSVETRNNPECLMNHCTSRGGGGM